MNEAGRTWIGADPGGVGCFGLAILRSDGSCRAFCLDHVDAAIDVVRTNVKGTPAGIGVDAPLWWCSGKGGLRKADQWIRDTYGLHSRNVQAVNSLWGSVVAQGMMFVVRMRETFPEAPVTETHPKAVLAALGPERWKDYFALLSTDVTLDAKPDNQRDAVISALAAREGFEGRWSRDLIVDRYSSEQNPSEHWLAPVHYFWPA